MGWESWAGHTCRTPDMRRHTVMHPVHLSFSSDALERSFQAATPVLLTSVAKALATVATALVVYASTCLAQDLVGPPVQGSVLCFHPVTFLEPRQPAVGVLLPTLCVLVGVICSLRRSFFVFLFYCTSLAVVYGVHVDLFLFQSSPSPLDMASFAFVIAFFGSVPYLIATIVHVLISTYYFLFADGGHPWPSFLLCIVLYSLAARSYEVAQRRSFAQNTTQSLANPASLRSLVDFYGCDPAICCNSSPHQAVIAIIRSILHRPEFRSNAVYELEYMNKVLSSCAFNVPVPRSHCNLPAALNDEETQAAFRILDKSINNWNFDIFAIANATRAQPLYYVGVYLFKRHGFIEKFRLNPVKLHAFLRQVEAGYASNPFHNSTHAADVTLNVNYLLTTGAFAKSPDQLSDLENMATILAAIVHDYQHPGLSNSFEVNSESERAYLYNDRSVLENFHISSAFSLLKNPAFNFMESLEYAQRRKVRALMVETVLATDMALHFEIVEQLKSGLARASPQFSLGNGPDRLLALRTLIKCADIGHTTKTSELHIRWSESIQDEFFSQGDLERRLGLPISPAMDRKTVGLASSQVGFLGFVAGPLFEVWANFSPEHKHMVTQLRTNQADWKRQVPPSS